MSYTEKHIESFGYPAVGRCIYCGATSCRLTKEHIVGKAIGGTVTLAKCSCSAPVGAKSKRRCSEITRYVEQFCFRNMLGHFRHREGFPVSKRHSQLPLHVVHRDGELEVKQVAVAEHSGMMTVPVFGIPGILAGRREELPCNVWAYIPNQDAVKSYPEGTRVGRTEFNGRIYARILAKIAHSYAAAEGILSNIDFAFLPDFILGDDEITATDYYVGCLANDLPADNVLHRVKLFNAKTENNQLFLVANIRLFAKFGAPQYHVVIGRLR